MDRLPPELVLQIAHYLDAFDIVKLHLLSKRLHEITRDDDFWKRLCFEDSNSAANQKRRDLQFIAPSIFRESARVFELQRRARALSASSGLRSGGNGKPNPGTSERVRAAANWDPSYSNERVDWYAEYIARHAPVSLAWLQQPYDRTFHDTREIRGLGVYERAGDSLLVSPLDDGAVGIWNIGRQDKLSHSESGALVSRSSPELLSSYRRHNDTTSLSNGGAGHVECVSIDKVRKKAYFASHNDLDEVDLETLRVTSHERYPFAISALSEATHPVPLTVATTHSLHLHDPRSPSNTKPSLIDYDGHIECNTASLPPSPYGGYPGNFHGNSRRHAPLFDAGPLSISHLPFLSGQGDISNGYICVAGRFPSILTYNRRMFPRLHSAIHSGSRLASMTSLPHPLLYSRSNPPRDADAAHTLIACGEYNGKGSLELYPFSTSGEPNPPLEAFSESSVSKDRTPVAPIIPYQNRTSASRSKLLSVAAHGTRIVFSDGDGGLKWVERDGHSLVRRWNINAYTASTSDPNSYNPYANNGSVFADSTNDGGDVARKILPVGSWEDGKGELAVWTGERIGILGFRPKPRFEWEQEREEVEGQAEDVEYAGRMRRALERQADEVRFVRGLGLGG
ncbi:MAG: hypothetical protein Q9166_003086 [cf. Caloplaca sp. 2 TL-2023]